MPKRWHYTSGCVGAYLAGITEFGDDLNIEETIVGVTLVMSQIMKEYKEHLNWSDREAIEATGLNPK